MPDPDRAARLGTLVASGLIVGERIWGVINAGLIVGFGKDAPIALVPEDFAPAPWLGVILFVGSIVWLYGWMLRRSGGGGRAQTIVIKPKPTKVVNRKPLLATLPPSSRPIP